MVNTEEYKLYQLQVMTRARGVGTRGVYILAPGRNPEEAKEYFAINNPKPKNASPEIAHVREISFEGFKIMLEKLV